METRIERRGRSLGVRLNKATLAQAGMREGDRVSVTAWAGRIVIESERPRYTLDELLAGITPENRHGEVDTGPPSGRELW